MPSNNIYDAPFYKPPKVGMAYPHQINAGQIILYKDSNWNSQSYKIDTSDTAKFPAGRPFSFSGSPLGNSVSWIAFNLPAGTVCTLVQHIRAMPSPTAGDPSKPYNFAGVGICVDLIGNGQVQTVDLGLYGANDLLTGGIWRKPDFKQGWFQLCEAADCNGRLNTIFFSEWTGATWHPLTNWALNGTGSSANYPCLTPPQFLTLAVNSDGSGQQLALGAANKFEAWTNKATVDFSTSNLDDAIHAFRYDLFSPVKAEIDSVTQTYKLQNVRELASESIEHTNGSGLPFAYDVTFAQGKSYSVTSDATLAYAVAIGLKQTTTVSQAAPGGEVSGSITTSFTAEVGQEWFRSDNKANTFKLTQAIKFNIPAWTKYSGKASISRGDISAVTETTKGRFYYVQKLPGACPVSPTEQGKPTLWVLEGDVAVTLTGSVASQVDIQVEAIPIPQAPA